jgi:hypothetical protein
MGGPKAGLRMMREVSGLYRRLAPINHGDHVVVAANPRIVVEASNAWQGARVLVGFGQNGADLALLRVLREPDWVGSHYDRLIIGSGDSIFVEAARTTCERGIAVGVVAPELRISARLADAVDFVRPLPNLETLRVVA